MNDRGEVVGQKKLPSNGEVVDFLKGFEDSMEVAIEATPGWYWLYDCLEDEGFDVKHSHPLRTKAIAYAKVKTDKVDSATLAHLLRSDLFGKVGMAFLHSLPLPENYKIALEGYLTVPDTVRGEIKAVSRRVQQVAEQDHDSMLLMTIPGAGQFKDFEGSMNYQVVQGIISDIERLQVRLQMPKFEYESEFSLKSVLANMGMPTAFSGDVDFSGMTGNRGLSIDDVIHKAFVSVDEAGTEAAAATAVEMLESEPIVQVEVNIDRPFLFLIRDIETGSDTHAIIISPELTIGDVCLSSQLYSANLITNCDF